MSLTNTVKELEENLDFGIQKLIKSEPGLILVNKYDEKHLDDVDGDADVLDWQGAGLGATTETKRNRKRLVLTRTRKTKKRSRFKSLSCWLKKLLKL